MPVPNSFRRFFSNASTQASTALSVVALAALFFNRVPGGLRWPVRVLVLAAVVLVIVRVVQGLRAHASWKGTIFSLILGVMMLGIVNWMCLIFMRIMGSRDDRIAQRGEIQLRPGARELLARMMEGNDGEGSFDKVVGWVPRVNLRTPGRTINSQGFRARHDYPVQPPNRDHRVLCMGDSFTLGVGVTDDQSYPAHAEALMPGWEWLNFGISGTCLTQAFLHYQQTASKFDGKHVIIGFMTNDAQRTVNCFRPFVNVASGCPMTKPFAFIDEKGVFSIKSNPFSSLDDYRRLLANEPAELRALLRQDYLTWGRTGTQVILEIPLLRTVSYACEAWDVPSNLQNVMNNQVKCRSFFDMLAAGDLYGREFWEPDSRGFRALCAMFDKFYQQVIADGRVPHIVIIPGPHDVDDWQRGSARQYQSLVRFLDQRGYHYLDFLDTLIGKHKNDLSEKALFVVRHYQGHVNRELAEKITEMVK